MIRIYKMRFMANQKKKLEEKKFLPAFEMAAAAVLDFVVEHRFYYQSLFLDFIHNAVAVVAVVVLVFSMFMHFDIY